MPGKIADERLAIVTVHAPEMPHERQRSLLVQRIEEFNLKFPVLIDNELVYFGELAAPGWPAIYLIDKQGRMRSLFLGETHGGFLQARAIEQTLRQLLAEK